MSTSLPSPLIPLPSDPHNSVNEDKDDPFATLFSAPTPRASRAGTPTLDEVADNSSKLPGRHSRKESTDSEFGSFVSVPSAEDPLRSSDSMPEAAPFTPLQNFELFDRFAEDAKVAAEKSKREVLDELLEHEDGPMYWSQSSSGANASRTSTPVPSAANATEPAAANVGSSKEYSLLDSSPITTSEGERRSRHLTRQHMSTEPQGSRSRSPPPRSPSLPPSSIPRISNPEVQRTQSSFFVPSSLPSRWVSSFLSSTMRPSLPRSRSSTEEARHADEDDSGKTSQHHQTSLPVALPSHLLDSLSSLTHSIPNPAPQTTSSPAAVDAAITHGSPFASHPFVPASGAPGFAGDRQWNKGFEFDQADVEMKTVRLVGRKEVTTPVLNEQLASMLRPHFPALARLPRSWLLLYSLDQHGVSLNTLYARCQNHTGGTLVVMQDSGNAVFGVWMGEGIHQSKGSYYGSGQSWVCLVECQAGAYL
ncbi:hypothetical protein AcW1_001994 [Taiwanofungus camphoratus]|nr:hypothetical protein AcV5_009992 [Antrodia cinnamomea]KAI0944238.1 hypothetical protein AcW1_001994 [Antrodia cinnamomea]KAI0945879.1 hypothetical protein AcV7_010000 [Antrodia cinnamomea]